MGIGRVKNESIPWRTARGFSGQPDYSTTPCGAYFHFSPQGLYADARLCSNCESPTQRSAMAKFDYKHAKEEIAQINAIVETCPDAVKEKCFELLFGAVFGKPEAAPTPAAATEPPALKPQNERQVADEAMPQGRKLPPNVLSFSRRYAVTPEELAKLFMLDHDPLLPIYKIPSTNIAQAQLYKVMMILLENGLLNNSLGATYAELRDSVKEDGYIDTNFNKNLRRQHHLFRGAITDEGVDANGTVELSGAGYEQLATIVKELAQS
jgi:hypothetical protein